MSLIEGLGDEVTIVFALLTIILVAVIAWVSTHTREIPFISVIVVELSRRSEHDRQAGTAHVDDTSSSPNETNTPDSEVVTKETNQNSSNESAEAANVTGNAVSQDADEIESTNSGSGSTLTGSSPVTDLLSTQGVEMSSNEGLNAISEIVHDSVGSDSLTGSLQSAEVAAGSSVAGDATTRSDTMVSDTTACDTTVSDATLTNTTEHDMKSELRHRRLAFFDGSKHSSNQLEDTVSLQTSKTSPDGRPSNSEVKSELSHAAPSNSVAASETESATGTPFTASSPHSEVEGESASIDTENLGEHSTSSSRSHDAGDGVNEADGSSSEIRVRLKYLNDTQRLVYTQPSQTVQEFRRWVRGQRYGLWGQSSRICTLISNVHTLRSDVS